MAKIDAFSPYLSLSIREGNSNNNPFEIISYSNDVGYLNNN